MKYFSAQLKPRTNDPGIGQRQQIFWRALRTTGVEIIEGKFSFVKQRLPLHPEQLDADGKVITTLIKRPEEKGTDVALASHLIFDALDGVADSYAVLTNDWIRAAGGDADAARARRGVVSVAGASYNKAFDVAGIRTVRQIRQGTLRASQFPATLVDGRGQNDPEATDLAVKKSRPSAFAEGRAR